MTPFFQRDRHRAERRIANSESGLLCGVVLGVMGERVGLRVFSSHLATGISTPKRLGLGGLR